jgi:hypothetical protein
LQGLCLGIFHLSYFQRGGIGLTND